MSRAPAFQFYPADWLSSPRITTMTPAEEGAYIRLLCYAWADSDCTIPDDDTELAQLSRLGEGWFNGGSTAIRKCFEPHPKRPGRLFNARLMEERKKQDAWRRKSREGGKRSAESRTLRSKEKQTEAEGWLNGGSRVVEPQINSSSSSSSSLKEINKDTLSADLPETHSAKRPRRSETKRHSGAVPLSDGFIISDDLWDWTVKKGFTRQWVERESERFCNDALAKAKKFVDWDAAFRNWLLKAEEIGASRNGHFPKKRGPISHARVVV